MSLMKEKNFRLFIEEFKLVKTRQILKSGVKISHTTYKVVYNDREKFLSSPERGNWLLAGFLTVMNAKLTSVLGL